MCGTVHCSLRVDSFIAHSSLVFVLFTKNTDESIVPLDLIEIDCVYNNVCVVVLCVCCACV